jgi:hypothetical protein
MSNEAKTSTVTTGGNKSKAQELVEAARRRNQIEQEIAEGEDADTTNEPATTEEEKIAEEQKKEAAEELASAKPQAVAGSLDGLDVEAMGDVKGDGGDAKNYADNDPDKALGVPTFEHGLAENKATGDTPPEVLTETRISKRTEAELARGREAVATKNEAREQATRGRVTVTDADDDPKGEKGKEAVEKAAKSKAKK